MSMSYIDNVFEDELGRDVLRAFQRLSCKLPFESSESHHLQQHSSPKSIHESKSDLGKGIDIYLDDIFI